jgi:hypothetical protein
MMSIGCRNLDFVSRKGAQYFLGSIAAIWIKYHARMMSICLPPSLSSSLAQISGLAWRYPV